MRSIAILIVVFGHFHIFLRNHFNKIVPFINLSINEILDYFINGFDGVDLFFALSGFLIGHSLLLSFVNNKLNFKFLVNDFWIRRWFRTLPNYFFILIISLFIYKLTILENHSALYPVDFYKYFIFIQNLQQGELNFFPESWSLSIEEWFYLSFPIALTFFVLFLSSKTDRKSFLLYLILFFILLGSSLRIYYTISHQMSLNISSWNREIRTSILMRTDAIIYGVLMAYGQIYFPLWLKKLRYYFFIIGICLLIISFSLFFIFTDIILSKMFAFSFYFNFVGLGMAMLIPFFYHLKMSNKLAINAFSLISIISYSTYLVNYSIVEYSIKYFIPTEIGIVNNLSKFILAYILTFFLSVILYKYIETPFMNLRKRILTN